jgi:hypothetical protein
MDDYGMQHMETAMMHTTLKYLDTYLEEIVE